MFPLAAVTVASVGPLLQHAGPAGVAAPFGSLAAQQQQITPTSLEEIEVELATLKLVLLNTYSTDTLAQLLEMYGSLTKHVSQRQQAVSTARSGASTSNEAPTTLGLEHSSQQPSSQPVGAQAAPHVQRQDVATQTEQLSQPLPSLEEAIALWCPSEGLGSSSMGGVYAPSGVTRKDPTAASADAKARHFAQNGGQEAEPRSRVLSYCATCGSTSSGAVAGVSGCVTGSREHGRPSSGLPFSSTPLSWRADLEFFDASVESLFSSRANAMLAWSDAAEAILLILLLAIQASDAGPLYVLAALLVAGAGVAALIQAGAASWYIQHREALLLGVRLTYALFALAFRQSWMEAAGIALAGRAWFTAYCTGMVAIPALFFRVRFSRMLPVFAVVFSATSIASLCDAAAAVAAGTAAAGEQLSKLLPTLALGWVLPMALLYCNEWNARKVFLSKYMRVTGATSIVEGTSLSKSGSSQHCGDSTQGVAAASSSSCCSTY